MSSTLADRPSLAKALEMLREGDILVVWKFDRLGRSVKQLVDLVGELHKPKSPPKDVAKNLGASIPTLYRWIPASAHA